MKTSSLPQSKSDSFFGMALAQAFMGMAFGPCAEQAWEVAENTSAVYEDRFKQKPANDSHTYRLGEKKSLGGTFARMTDLSLAEMDRAAFQPFFKPAGPAFAF